MQPQLNQGTTNCCSSSAGTQQLVAQTEEALSHMCPHDDEIILVNGLMRWVITSVPQLLTEREMCLPAPDNETRWLLSSESPRIS